MTKKTHDKREHKELGGSSANRWPRCSGSIFLGRKVGPRSDSKASLYGTDTHELGEICIDSFLKHKLLGTDPEKRYRKARTFRDEIQVAGVEYYRDYIWEKVLQESITNKAWGIEDKLIHTDCDKMGGICDFWAVYINDKGERVLHIVDYKNGTDPVEIKHEQFLCYGVCMRSMLRAEGKDIDRLITHIVSPNFLNGKKDASKAYIPKQMDAKEEWFLKAAHRIYVEKKCQFKAGSWCKYCPGQALCEKHAKKVEVDTGLSLLSTEVNLPEVKSLTSEQAIALALNSDKLSQLCKACKAYIISEHMQGRALKGCKVITTSPRRSMPKDTTKLEAKLKAQGFKDHEIFNYKMKGVGAIEKILGAKKKLLEKYVTFTKPTASVVSPDDPRPAATDLSELLID